MTEQTETELDCVVSEYLKIALPDASLTEHLRIIENVIHYAKLGKFSRFSFRNNRGYEKIVITPRNEGHVTIERESHKGVQKWVRISQIGTVGTFLENLEAI